MPIVARIPPAKLIQTVLSIIDYFRKNPHFKIKSMKLNGYFLFRYRGVLLVRKGFSDVIIVHDFDAVKRYLIHVMENVLRGDYVTWTKTIGMVELIIDIKRKDKHGLIVLETTNDLEREDGNLNLKVITPKTSNKDEEETPDIKSSLMDNTKELVDIIDEIIINEDLKKLVPIDIYKLLSSNDVNAILDIISRNNGVASIVENVNSE